MQITAEVKVEFWTDLKVETRSAASAAAEQQSCAHTSEHGCHQVIIDDPFLAVASHPIIRVVFFLF